MNMQTEPARFVGIVSAVAMAVIAALVYFGLPVSDGMQKGITGFIAVVGPLVYAELTRRRVFSPHTVNEVAGDNYVDGYADGHEEGLKTAKYNDNPTPTINGMNHTTNGL